MDWLGAPDQGAVTSPLRPLGRNGEEIELTICRLALYLGTQLLPLQATRRHPSPPLQHHARAPLTVLRRLCHNIP
jgi:hypothetical protein